ncbi:hypothetical protein BDV10DRAFT_185295 [Aspergillus recurvatus]
MAWPQRAKNAHFQETTQPERASRSSAHLISLAKNDQQTVASHYRPRPRRLAHPPNYARYADALRAHGFTVHCPLLPTCNRAGPGQPCLNDDVKLVWDLVSSLTNTGHRILMVMHSYGGAVGTEAVQGLAYPIPASTNGAPAGGVIHLLYLCAYILPPATRIWDIVTEAGFERIFDEYVHTDEQDRSTFPRDPALMFSVEARQSRGKL